MLDQIYNLLLIQTYRKQEYINSFLVQRHPNRVTVSLFPHAEDCACRLGHPASASVLAVLEHYHVQVLLHRCHWRV